MPLSAEFVWTSPDASSTAFVVELYETHVAEVRDASTGAVVVHSPRWDATKFALVLRSGYGPAYLSDRATRESFFGAATNALRDALLAVPMAYAVPWLRAAG